MEGVAEVVGEVAKGVDFELAEDVHWELVEEPVDDHAAFDAALGVEH